MSEITIYHESSEPNKDLRERFNALLADKFGIDSITGLPMWRISWAQDHYNKMYGTFNDFTREGIFLRTVTEVREIPKYPHLKGLYILELLQIIPDVNMRDLPTGRLSYECMHPYMHAVTEKYLPPNWLFTEWVIDCYYAGIGKQSLHKYVDPEADGNNGLEESKRRCQEIMNYLYGNDTEVSDALTYGNGVFLDSRKQGSTPN